MTFKLQIEKLDHSNQDLGEFPSQEAAVAKVQEMITLYNETDLQVGDDRRWESWLDVPEEIRQRCCFESDQPVLKDTETGEDWWWSDDTNNFEDPESF